MIRELLEDAIARSEELRRSLSDADLLRRAASLWVRYRPSPREARKAGIDSGWNYRQLQGFYLYAVDAASVDQYAGYVAEPRHELGVSTMELEVRGRIIHEPHLFLEAKGMAFEGELAFESSPKVDLVLLDGSFIARTSSQGLRLIPGYEDAISRIPSLGNVVFIAKRSQGRELLGGPLGDIFYFSRASASAGFSAPCSTKGVTHFYARLEDGAECLRIEVVGDMGAPPCDEASRDGDWKEVMRLLDELAHGAVGGYPYVLIQAHEIAHIGDREMEAIANLLGAGILESGREVLGER